MRIYRILIPDSIPPQRLDKYLRQALPLLPEHVIRDAFSARDVKLDGKRVAADVSACPGELVEIYTAYEASIPTVYEDTQVLLLNKPAGISCEDDGRGGMTVLSVMQERAQGVFRPRLCHRLDNQTSGLLILAKTDEAEAALLRAFAERTLDKRYECLVKGTMRPEAAELSAYLVRDDRQSRVRIVTHASPGARPIRTAYRLIRKEGELSRLSVDLLTGRMHQIRAHLAFLSHPILGDDLYGDRALNRRMKTTELKLCAVELTLHTESCLDYLNGKAFRIPAPF
ncbi:MAG: RluA family pseudouridine synthase [Clostridia bacterium]|nr:RluA family pseudouridine synthase [Clostridia bacterium]